ncbi:BMC domain-containing protein [Radiobacillus sp. PE A8.2]|uniref:BMC domain-containing protein n=1 Tax=Radiobacillus sp. PE A8.2 TaxID=3380349 RepID=UPI00388F3AD5
MNRSLGLIEVRGTVTAAATVDVMVKNAFVEIRSIERVGSGLITIMIEGDLASVQAALEIGAEEALKYGELIAVKSIPRPDQGLASLLSPEKRGDDK